MDLGIVLSVVSSFRNKPLPADLVAFGEVGLSGEVRSISQIEGRVKEAAKLGFKKCILPASGKKTVQDDCGMELIFIENIKDLQIFLLMISF